MLKHSRLRTIKYRIFSLVLAMTFVIELVFASNIARPLVAEAAGTLTISQAIALSKANSDVLEQKSIEIAQKQAEYTSAVKAIALKRAANSRIKWSFLLSFSYPSTPDEAEQYDYVFKPLELSQQLTKLRHSYNAVSNDITQETYDAFVEIYTLQERIAFNNQQISNKKSSYRKLRAKVAAGTVEQGTVDAIKSAIESLQTTVADDKASLQTAKERLSEKIGLDVTTNYAFQNPYQQSTIPRSELNNLIDYALENDDTYYQMKMDATTARVSLQTHWKLVSGHYNASDVDLIRSYVSTALNDGEISKKSFKASYDEFIKAIDRYWEGKRKIFWFITIPKVWSKDEDKDGTNWITDDPQVLYSETLAYAEKRKERDSYKTTLTNNIKDTYNGYVAARKAYKSAQEGVSNAMSEQDDAGRYYKMGQMDFDEYIVYVDAYASAYDNYLTALSDYSNAIYLLNKVTCGKTLLYLFSKNDTSANLDGSPYTDEDVDYCYYYIEPIVEDQAFEFHAYVPDGFKVELEEPVKVKKTTKWEWKNNVWVRRYWYENIKIFTPDTYELWIGTTRIGTRTSVNEPIRHLQVDLGDDGQDAFVRLFSGGVALCDCYFDTMTDNGRLEVVVDRAVIGKDVQLGTYSKTTTDNTVVINISPSKELAADAKTYRIMYSSGEYLQGEDYINLGDKFTYLHLLDSDLSTLKIEFYDDNNNIVERGTFDTEDMKIMQDLSDN